MFFFSFISSSATVGAFGKFSGPTRAFVTTDRGETTSAAEQSSQPIAAIRRLQRSGGAEGAQESVRAS